MTCAATGVARPSAIRTRSARTSRFIEVSPFRRNVDVRDRTARRKCRTVRGGTTAVQWWTTRPSQRRCLRDDVDRASEDVPEALEGDELEARPEERARGRRVLRAAGHAVLKQAGRRDD